MDSRARSGYDNTKRKKKKIMRLATLFEIDDQYIKIESIKEPKV